MGSTVAAARTQLLVCGLLLPLCVLGAIAPSHQPTTSDDQQLASADGRAKCLIKCTLPAIGQQLQRTEIDRLAHDMTQQIVRDLSTGQLRQRDMTAPLWFEHRVSERLNQQQQQQHHQQQQREEIAHVRQFVSAVGGREEEERLFQQRERQQFELQQQLHRNLFEQPRFEQYFTQQQQQYQQQISSNQQQFQQQQQQQQTFAIPLPLSHQPPTHVTRFEQTRREETHTSRNVQQPKQQLITTVYQPAAPRQTAVREEFRQRERTETAVRQPQQNRPVVIRTHQPQVAQATHVERNETHDHSRTVVRPVRPVAVPPHVLDIHRRRHQQVVDQQRARLVNDTQYIRYMHEQRQKTRPQPAQQPLAISTTSVQSNVETVNRESATTADLRLPVTHHFRPADDTRYRVQHEQNAYEKHETVEERRPPPPRPLHVQIHVPAVVRPSVNEQRHEIERHVEVYEQLAQPPNYRPQWRIDWDENVLRQQHHEERVVQATTTTTTTPAPPIRRTEHTTTTITRLNELRRDLQHYNIAVFTLPQLQSAIRTGHFWDSTQLYVYNTTSGHFLPTGTSAPPVTLDQTTSTNTTTHTVDTETRTTEQRRQQQHILQPLPATTTTTTLVQREHLTHQQVLERVHELRAQLIVLGYQPAAFSQQMLELIVHRGGFVHDGATYFVTQSQRQPASEIVHTATTTVEQRNVTESEHRERAAERQLQQLHIELQRIGADAATFGDYERNQTLRTGVFIRSGIRYTYDNETERFVGERLSAADVQRIYERMQQLLRHYGYRQTTHAETERMLQLGGFCRAGWRWVYESRSGALHSTGERVDATVELTAAEFEAIRRRIAETLERLGYAQMSHAQCVAAVVSGSFERGGITYRLQTEQDNAFRSEALVQAEYEAREQLLIELLRAIGVERQWGAEELRAVIYRGHFEHENHRYEYNARTRHYEQMDIDAETFERAERRLAEQLERIGYAEMSLVERNQTLYTHVFYFNGGEWVYRYDTELYERGEPAVTAGGDDGGAIQTVYSAVPTTTEEPAEVPIEVTVPTTTERRQLIHADRGDQPPQTFVEDYSAEQEAAGGAVPAVVEEEEPGVGYYPVEVTTERATQASAVVEPQPVQETRLHEPHYVEELPTPQPKDVVAEVTPSHVDEEREAEEEEGGADGDNGDEEGGDGEEEEEDAEYGEEQEIA